ncbi:MAG: insulinase family protein [Betaproteobacteria bacterium]|nr:insulinase family protein [Betaproteobacteria bacterium]
MREHYKTYFHPDNAEAILAGDFDAETALALFERRSAPFRGAQADPRVITVEPPQEGERRAVVRRPGTLGVVMIGYIRPAALHPDFIALEVLASVLADGVNSRLYQALVDRGLATSVNASNYTLRDPYPLLVTATCAPGKTHEEVEAAIKAPWPRWPKGRDRGGTPAVRSSRSVAVVRARDGTYNFASTWAKPVAPRRIGSGS